VVEGGLYLVLQQLLNNLIQLLLVAVDLPLLQLHQQEVVILLELLESPPLVVEEGEDNLDKLDLPVDLVVGQDI
jgi:hypothetical protein